VEQNKDCLPRNKRTYNQLQHVDGSNTGIGKTAEVTAGYG